MHFVKKWGLTEEHKTVSPEQVHIISRGQLYWSLPPCVFGSISEAMSHALPVLSTVW